ncbi:MAG: outer membrane beta-barrel protein [Halobacteriovoraceae bacterium]|jgi:outer membrane protein W|nr:outer membrane beta-barrel protein [Halobacteriovoraceae bacterium]
MSILKLSATFCILSALAFSFSLKAGEDLAASSRISAIRKKLRQQNEEIIKKRIEQVRLEEELRLERRLKAALTGNMHRSGPKKKKRQVDRIKWQQSAAQKLTTTAAKEKSKLIKRIKVIPYAGVANFSAENESYEAKINTGVNVELELSPRLAVGAGVDYSALDREDTLSAVQAPLNGFQQINQVEEFGYKRINLNVNAKYFFLQGKRIRPFVGAALGFNRSTVKFDQKATEVANPFAFNPGTPNQLNEVNSSNMTGSAIIGAEMALNKSIGVNLNLKYTKALSNGYQEHSEVVSKTTADGFSRNLNYDEQRLNKVGFELEDASVASINAGLIIRF